MKILMLFILCWLTLYVTNVARAFAKARHALRIRNKIVKRARDYISKPSEKRKLVSFVLTQIPETNRILKYNYISISHGDDMDCALKKIPQLIDNLDDEIDRLNNASYHSFNPLNSLRNLLRTPAWILAQFGFRFKPSTANLISFLGWLIPILLTIYQSEIHNLLTGHR